MPSMKKDSLRGGANARAWFSPDGGRRARRQDADASEGRVGDGGGQSGGGAREGGGGAGRTRT